MKMLKETTLSRNSLALTKRLTAWLLMFALVFYSMPVYALAEDIADAVGDEVAVSEEVSEPAAEENSVDEPAAEVTEPADEEQAAEPTEPADEEQAAEPTEPADEEQAAEPTEPADEEQAAEPTEPADEEQAAEPIEPADEEQAAEPTEPEQVEAPAVSEDVKSEEQAPTASLPIEQVPFLPEIPGLIEAVQPMLAAMPMLLQEEEQECTCEYMCVWFWNEYININEDCPVCSHATEEELDPYLLPLDPAGFACKGTQVIIPGKDPNCTHNAVVFGGSLWESWFPGGGSDASVPATCKYPATVTEPIECMGCGAKWLWNFDENSQPDLTVHMYQTKWGEPYPDEVKEATCTEDGSETYICLLCGEAKIDVTPAQGHKIDEATIKVVEPTCTEAGSQTGFCTACEKDVVEIIPAAGHKFAAGSVDTVMPTCTTPGSTTGYCTVCEQEIEEGLTAALGHDYIENVTKEATCTEDGSKTITCSRCDYSDEVVIPSAGGHRWPDGDNVHRFDRGICTVCGTTAYWVYTYEEGATPSGSGYEIKLCAMVMQEADGTVYMVDSKGNRLPDADFEVVINTSLMGKNKTKLENGVAVVTKVVGYRNPDVADSPIYKEGDRIAVADVPAMYVKEYANLSNYQSMNSRKVIFLEAVREKLPSFGPAPVVPEVPVNPVDPNQPVVPGVPVTPEVPVVPEAPAFAVGMVAYGATLQDNMVPRSSLAATSAGIKTDFVYNDAYTTCVITYTIPEGYAGSSVNIDATKDVMLAYNTIETKRFGYNGSQPGDTLGPVYIRLVNLSGKTLSYDDGSFVLQSPSYAGESAYINPIYTFDGAVPPASSVPSRVSNGALRLLYDVTTDLSHYELSDEVLGETLRSKGYAGGVADLHQYYLDYYNNFYSEGSEWQSLSEVPFELLVQRDEGVFGGQSSSAGLKETNPEVAGVGFSFFYTRLMSVVPGNAENLKDFGGGYAVGNYMKQYVSYNDNANAVWGQVAPGADAQLEGMSIYINGEANDFYQQTAWGIEVGFSFSLQPEKPEKPEEPPTPDTPEDPGDDPELPIPPTEIEEPPVPQIDNPTEENYLPDDGVPLSEMPQEEETILDEEVPLAEVPQTGDNLILWFFAAAISGVACLVAGRKRG